MCARSLEIRFAPEANQDLADIILYGLRTWGRDRARRYYEEVEDAIARLANAPFVGRRREDVVPGSRTWPVGHHVILYRVAADGIDILRIYHERADLPRAKS